MDVLFMVAALVFTAMTEAAAPLERFTRDPGSDITLKCLTNKSDEWINLTWDRIRETGFDVIGTTEIQDKGNYMVKGNNEHFKIHRTSDTFTLSITNVQPSDSGIYCCMWKKPGRCIIRSAAILVVVENALSTTSTPSSRHQIEMVTSASGTGSMTATYVHPETPQQRDCEPLVTVALSLGRALLLCVAVIAVLAYMTYLMRTGGKNSSGGHRRVTNAA